MRNNKLIQYIKQFILSAFAIVLLSNCTKGNDSLLDNQKESVYISISPQIEQTYKTKVLENAFEKNDNIGIYVVPYNENNTTPGNLGTDVYAANQMHIFDGSSWRLSSGKKIPWPASKRKVDIYGYYPHSYMLDNENPNHYFFYTWSDQSSKENFEENDFLWAKTSAVMPTGLPIDLTFSHLMCKIRVNLSTSFPFLKDLLPDAIVYISNANLFSTINLSDGSIVNGGGAPSLNKDIEIFGQVEPTFEYLKSAEGIIAPQHIPAGTLFIKIKVSIGSNGQFITYYLPHGITFESGKEYTFNINISEYEIHTYTEPIRDWQ